MSVVDGASECSSMESINGSWIKLDSKNGNSPRTSPKLSDDEGMTAALADAQTESLLGKSQISTDPEEAASKEVKSGQNVSEWIQKFPDEVTETKERKGSRLSLRGSKVISSGYDLAQSPVFYVSTLVLTHTFVFAIGIYVGRRMAMQSR